MVREGTNRDAGGISPQLNSDGGSCAVAEKNALIEALPLEERIPQSLVCFRFGMPGTCTYCGNTAKAIDHCILWSFLSAMHKRHSWANRRGITTYTCPTCNSKLSDRFFDTFLERVEFINGYWQERYFARAKKQPAWSQDELMTVKYSLRSFIKNKLDEVGLLKTQSEWIGTDEFRYELEEVRCTLDYNRENESFPILERYFGSSFSYFIDGKASQPAKTNLIEKGLIEPNGDYLANTC
jgi:hypothetical protein